MMVSGSRVAMFAALGGVLTMLVGAGGSTGTRAITTAATAPKDIVIGTLYSGSGSFANSSLPEFQGLK